MKKYLLLSFALIFSLLGFAKKGGNMSSEKRAEQIVKRLSDSIDLTSEQKKQLQTTFSTFHENMKELRKEKNKAAMKEARSAQDVEVKRILASEEKYTKYLAMKKNAQKKGKEKVREKRKEKSKGNQGENSWSEKRLEKLSDSLNLTSSQKDSMRVIMKEKQELRENFSQKENKKEEDKEDYKQKMQMLEQRTKLLLGDEKYKQLEELRKKEVVNTVKQRRGNTNK
jgi:hypothetical protein